MGSRSRDSKAVVSSGLVLETDETSSPTAVVGPPSVLAQGEWIGEYEILERLRHGGMATLFLGRKHGAAGFARNAAIKVIHPHLSFDHEFVRMFVDEARICAQISHPNVIHVEAFGEENGLYYMVMEYLEACAVSELLRVFRRLDEKTPVEMAANIVLQIAGGLHAVHEARGLDSQPLNIVHRDVSPSNILVSTDGHVKLIDFGIAKSRGRYAETQVGQGIKGKLKYIAPEQASEGPVDRRADIFSLGVVFWELLVGKHLFPDENEVALLRRFTEPNIVAPSRENPAVPAALDDVVLAMLAQKPNDRIQDAWEVRRRIVAALPAAASRQSDELSDISTLVRAHINRPVSEPSSHSYSSLGANPLGSGSLSWPKTPAPPEYDIEIAHDAAKKPSFLATHFLHLLLLVAAIVLSVLLGLNLLKDHRDAKQDQRDIRPTPAPTGSIVPATPNAQPVQANTPTPETTTQENGAPKKANKRSDSEQSAVADKKTKAGNNGSARRKKRKQERAREPIREEFRDTETTIRHAKTVISTDFD